MQDLHLWRNYLKHFFVKDSPYLLNDVSVIKISQPDIQTRDIKMKYNLRALFWENRASFISVSKVYIYMCVCACVRVSELSLFVIKHKKEQEKIALYNCFKPGIYASLENQHFKYLSFDIAE